MGPEPILGALAWLGILAAVAMVVAAIRKPTIRAYLALVAVPGIAFAAFCVQGLVGPWRVVIGNFFAFFLVGAVIGGAPLAGVYWLWVHRRAILDRGLFE